MIDTAQVLISEDNNFNVETLVPSSVSITLGAKNSEMLSNTDIETIEEIVMSNTGIDREYITIIDQEFRKLQSVS